MGSHWQVRVHPVASARISGRMATPLRDPAVQHSSRDYGALMGMVLY